MAKFLLACSATKAAAAGELPIGELYRGPLWLQVRRAGVLDRAAALSAKHGFLRPGDRVARYDLVLDQERADELAGDEHQAQNFATWCAGDRVIAFGGARYRAVIQAWKKRHAENCERVELVAGSFLAQRKRLGQELAAELELLERMPWLGFFRRRA